MIKMQLGGVIKKRVGNKVYYPTVNKFEIFEDPFLSDEWYFELSGKVYGPFDSEEEAKLVQGGMIDDAGREECGEDECSTD